MIDKVQKAIDFAVSVAKNDSHGYDQGSRFGNPDYDCSGLVITSFENAGVKVKAAGASYTGNMRPAFLKCGFIDVINAVDLKNASGMLPGDVLLHEGKHTGIYLGNGQLVHASINENKKIVGGKSGDQTGKEICVRSYYNHPWNSVLRYIEPPIFTYEKKYLRDISTYPKLKLDNAGEYVVILQTVLNGMGYNCGKANGVFGLDTDIAVKKFQIAYKLGADGVVGSVTWKELMAFHTVKVNPKDIRAAAINCTSDKLPYYTMVNANFFGKEGIIGWLISEGKILHERREYLHWSGNYKGTFIVYKDGTVGGGILKDKDIAGKAGISFLVQGYNLNPLDIAKEGFTDMSITRTCIRPAIGYDGKDVILFTGYASAAEMASYMDKIGCKIRIALDGGDSTNFKVDSKFIYKTDRVLKSVIYC